MLYRPRTQELFNKVFDVLVRLAGAPEVTRADFINTVVGWSERDPYETREFRFIGSLGFGGKFWLTPESFHVSAYPEDINEQNKRQNTITTTNEELKKLFVPPETDHGN